MEVRSELYPLHVSTAVRFRTNREKIPVWATERTEKQGLSFDCEEAKR